MSWRFVPYACYDAATNMAIDEYLLERHLAGEIPPTLRLYGFKPPAVTIGKNQDLDEDTMQRIGERGFVIARRPTGGRAVLHYQDITYAFIGSEIGVDRYGVLKVSVTGAYKQICAGLQEALNGLGLKAVLGESGSAYRNLSDCFLATTPADLQVNGLKLAGSAQLRRRTAVLQHGSIPLFQEQSLMHELLTGVKVDTRTMPGMRHANLFELINQEIPLPELAVIFKDGFARAFAVDFEQKDLTASEIEESKAFMLSFA